MRSAADMGKAAALAGLILAAAFPALGKPAPGCRDCHEGDAPTREEPALVSCPRTGKPGSLALSEAPVSILLGKGEGKFGAVRFAHRAHAEMAAMGKGCAVCHHHGNARPVEKCAECHSKERKRADPSIPDLRSARHRLCIECHREWGGAAADCASCHEKKTPGNSQSVAWPANRFHAGLSCSGCHDKPGKFDGAKPSCALCHPGFPKGFKHEKTGFALDEIHAALDCAICHKGPGYASHSCADCHEDSPGRAAATTNPPRGR